MNRKRNNFSDLKVNPAIAALEEYNEPPAELRGFLGTSEDGTLRLSQTNMSAIFLGSKRLSLRLGIVMFLAVTDYTKTYTPGWMAGGYSFFYKE